MLVRVSPLGIDNPQTPAEDFLRQGKNRKYLKISKGGQNCDLQSMEKETMQLHHVLIHLWKNMFSNFLNLINDKIVQFKSCAITLKAHN